MDHTAKHDNPNTPCIRHAAGSVPCVIVVLSSSPGATPDGPRCHPSMTCDHREIRSNRPGEPSGYRGHPSLPIPDAMAPVPALVMTISPPTECVLTPGVQRCYHPHLVARQMFQKVTARQGYPYRGERPPMKISSIHAPERRVPWHETDIDTTTRGPPPPHSPRISRTSSDPGCLEGGMAGVCQSGGMGDG